MLDAEVPRENLDTFLQNAVAELQTGRALAVSRHLNELSGCELGATAGLELVLAGARLVRTAVAKIRLGHPGPAIYAAGLVFPLKDSNALGEWVTGDWSRVAMEPEPPSLFVIRSMNLLTAEREEYRVRIHLPENADNELSAWFRSFREPEAILNDWSFCNAMELIGAINDTCSA